MVVNIVLWLILVVLVALLGWLASRAWRSRRALVKWPGFILSGLLTLIVGLITVLAGLGLYRLYAPISLPVPSVTVAGTSDQIQRGAHLATTVCAGCHSSTGTLPLNGGGKNLSEETGLPLGTIVAPNLTPGGPIKSWSDGEIARAIRQTVNPQGHVLLMPAKSLSHLSDGDVQALVAYLRSQPAVQTQSPAVNPSLLLAVLVGAGLFDISPAKIAEPVAAPQAGPSVEYGQYVVSYYGCKDCHGANLTGGKPPSPAGPNLTVIVPHWTKDNFLQTIRTGIDPTGHALNPALMPWKDVSKMDDVELEAIYQYLHSLTPVIVSKQ
jgi:mono/diheme cytochrome c family protein